jgi:hypothetical protein
VFIILHESEFLSLSLEGRSPSWLSYADEREDVRKTEEGLGRAGCTLSREPCVPVRVTAFTFWKINFCLAVKIYKASIFEGGGPRSGGRSLFAYKHSKNDLYANSFGFAKIQT